jgi:methionine synthase II (cobalamin-independent)
VTQHLKEIAGLVPGAELILQIDEPSLPAVLNGTLPTASGFGRLRAVEAPVVAEGLTAVLEGATRAGAVSTVVHCCHQHIPVALLARTPATAIAADVSLLDTARWDQIAEAAEGGLQLWAGVPVEARATGPALRPDVVADAVWLPWRRLGLPAASAGAVVITPSCGLAGASRDGARTALTLVKAAAAVLAERSQD